MTVVLLLNAQFYQYHQGHIPHEVKFRQNILKNYLTLCPSCKNLFQNFPWKWLQQKLVKKNSILTGSIYTTCNKWGVKLAKTQYLPISFAKRLLQSRRIYRLISICKLCLQLENLTSHDTFKQFYCICGYVPTVNNAGMHSKL